MDKELHILIGGIGTGKSTYAKKLSKELEISVFCPDDIEEKYKNLNDSQIDKMVDNELKNYLDSGDSFILDGKCLMSKERIEIIKRAKSKGYKTYGHDFGGGNVVSLLRRLSNPRKYFSKQKMEIY